MEKIDILDVTALEPRMKHPKIFEIYDDLNPGEAFIINNDHDPKPLYYQLIAERGRTFSWEYLENGPETWLVKITKNHAEDSTETIGEIVSKDYRKAQVFKSFGIDFCCGGKKTIAQACQTKGIAAEEVESALNAVKDEPSPSESSYLNWKLDFLADYIINTHHQYVKDNTEFIRELANKVARVHGDRHPEMIEVAAIFSQMADHLLLHLRKEEQILFPFIRELVHAEAHSGLPSGNVANGVASPIQVMEAEHEEAGEAMQTIRSLTHNFRLPEDACASYTILFKKLDEFENDLYRHVHLENNVLFPKAILLEKELREG